MIQTSRLANVKLRQFRENVVVKRLHASLLLSVKCYAWIEYKFTCVCVCVCVSVTLSVNSPTSQTPQRIFKVDSLKDADLRKDVPFVVSRMNNHI